MKRYLIFCGDYYYPGGGAEDFFSAKGTLEQAEAVMADKEFQRGIDWAHIFDLRNGTIVKRWDRK